MNKNLVTIKDVSYEAPSRELFNNVSFAINAGDRIGLVGNNGVGKTTLLKIISGEIQPSSGQIINGQTNIGLLPQNLQSFLSEKVYDFVGEVTGVKQAKNDFEESCKSLENSSDEALVIYADALERFEKLNVGEFDANLTKALGEVGLRGVDIDRTIGEFSGGQQQKIALAAVLASKQDLILLDEPTNSMDEQGIVILEKFINESPATFLVVSHDRRFLKDVSNRIVELIGVGGVRRYNLGYDEYIAARKKEKDTEENQYDQFQTEKKRLQKAAREAKIKANSALRKKHSDDNDKLNNNFRKENAGVKLSQGASGLQARLDRMTAIERPEQDFSLDFEIDELSLKQSSGIVAEKLKIEYSDGTVIGPIDLRVDIGDRVAITGKNGSGKSSFLKAIVGLSKGQTSGNVKINDATKIIYIDQEQTLPFSNKTALDNLKNLTTAAPLHELISALIKFGINKNTLQTTPAKRLSGGERMKVLLAATVLNKANILIMDEPTNNLDIPTIEGLAGALNAYRGAIIVVSHDRDFLDDIRVDRELQI